MFKLYVCLKILVIVHMLICRGGVSVGVPGVQKLFTSGPKVAPVYQNIVQNIAARAKETNVVSQP